MKSIWSKVARGACAALVAAAIATLACTCRNGVETDLYALLDSTRQSVLRALADNVGGQLRILLEGPDLASLDAPAAEFKAYMGSHTQTDTGSITNTLTTLAPRSGGLLTEETRALLVAGEYGTVATNAATALFSGLLAPAVSVKVDPYLLATDYLTHLQSRDDRGWSIRDGDPVREQDGRCYRLLVFDGFKTSDSAFICEVLKRVRAFNGRNGATGTTGILPVENTGTTGVSPVVGHDVQAYVSGAPFHAALATERSKREINILSAMSLVIVLALGVWLFRSVRFVVPLIATLASAFLVATAVVFAVWGRPHVLTFVFGTTLIGLGVDYVYHACAAEDVRTVRRPLAYALVTTLACFVPLAFSGVTVLRQMSLFTGAGLLTVWAAVMAWFGRAGARPSHWDNGRLARCTPTPLSPGGRSKLRPSRLSFFIFLSSLFILLSAGALRIRLSSDPAQFYRPDPFLAEGERKFYELNQAAAARFAVVEGATVQEALEREETTGVKGLSAIIPSLKRQRENQALVAELRKRTGSAYTALTGVPVRAGADTRGLLDPEAITDPLLEKLIRSMCVKANGRVLLVSPLPIGESDCSQPPQREGRNLLRPPGASAAGVTIVEPKRELMSLFDAYAREAYRLLGISFVLLAVLLTALLRRRFLAGVLPVAAAALATLGVLGWCGVQLTFFHALCFFVCTGLGLDYVIFHLGDSLPRTRRVVFVSFLTSAAAFGLLAFTSFPVTRAMGATLALGLFFVYLFSSCIGRGFCGKLSVTHEEKR